uniref:Uncharacterized protein n=1 Tax=Ditylum brightwellii TaxID=49249 RepID=A0A7S4W1K6_9STRA
MTAGKINWTKISAKPDPQHGAPCSRSSHGLSISPDGSRVFLYGGEHVARTPLEPSQSLWSCDCENNEWSWRNLSAAIGSSAPSPRVAHAQAIVNDRVYIFGGRSGISMNESPLNDLWALDTSDGVGNEKWVGPIEPSTSSSSDEPPEHRSFHKMISVGTDLYVFGGCGSSGRLNDLHKFDTIHQTWSNLGKAHLLKGRGGANLIYLKDGHCLIVVAGFVGSESNDGQKFILSTEEEEKGTWDDSLLEGLDNLRPRSVCISASFHHDDAATDDNVALIFGGEVNPSELGHEGAGGFENDLILLDGKTGALKETIKAAEEKNWPEPRGWSDGTSISTADKGRSLYLFGGLTGDDQNPKRLDDFWCCDIKM